MFRIHKKINMLSGPIYPGLIAFALPLVITNLLQLLFHTADIIVIGRFGDANALAAVGVSSMATGTFVNFITHLTVGVTVVAGMAIGSRKPEQLRNTVHAAMGLGLALGLLLMLIMFFTMRPLLMVMKTPAEIFPEAYRYLCFFLPSIPACCIYNFGASLLRAKGDTQRPFVILTISGVINVLLNLIFVLIFKMGVAGVALATTIAFYLSMTMMLLLLKHETDDFRLNFRKITLRSSALHLILKMGLTNAMQGMMFQASNIVVQSAINGFGPFAIAGNAASANIGGYMWMSMNGFGHGCMAYTAQNSGARQYKRVRDVYLRTMALVFVLGLLESIFCVTFDRQLLGMYTRDPQVIEAGLYRLHLLCGLYFIAGIMDVSCSVLRGMGYPILPAVVSLAGALGLRVLWIFTLFQIPRFHTLFWLYMTYPVSWTATLIVLLWIFHVIYQRKLREVRA